MNNKLKIQTDKISAFDRDFLARSTIEATANYFRDPVVQKRFEVWKKNRNKETIIYKK